MPIIIEFKKWIDEIIRTAVVVGDSWPVIIRSYKMA